MVTAQTQEATTTTDSHGKAICNANPSSFQLICRNNTSLLPQIQLCTAKHNMDHSLLLHTHTYTQAHFLLHTPITSFTQQRALFFLFVKQWEQLNSMDCSAQAPKEQPAESECVSQPGVNFSMVLHIHSVVLGKRGHPHHTVHTGQDWHNRKAQLDSWKCIPS